jgi:hypothetical protein
MSKTQSYNDAPGYHPLAIALSHAIMDDRILDRVMLEDAHAENAARDLRKNQKRVFLTPEDQARADAADSISVILDAGAP